MENECRFMMSSSNGLMHMCEASVCKNKEKDSCPVIVQGNQFHHTAIVANIAEMSISSVALSEAIIEIARKIYIEKTKLKEYIDSYQECINYQKGLRIDPGMTDDEQDDILDKSECISQEIEELEYALNNRMGNLKGLIIEMTKVVCQ